MTHIAFADIYISAVSSLNLAQNYSKQSINIWNPQCNIKYLNLLLLQVFYRQEGHSNSQVIETQKPQAVVPLPDAGVYIIEVRAYSEGGDGTASSQIRVPSYSGKF